MNFNDKKYWMNFYSLNNDINLECSNFCNFVIDYFKNVNISDVLDCGCGNGRDSYALSNIYNVDGIDNCGVLPINKNNVKFYSDDLATFNKDKYDLIYSRFSFHSMTNEQHIAFLDSIKTNSYLVIETRSQKSENDEVVHGRTHYRNYTDFNYLKNLLTVKNFDIIYINEDINFAKYKNENPYCIRVICKKNNL